VGGSLWSSKQQAGGAVQTPTDSRSFLETEAPSLDLLPVSSP